MDAVPVMDITGLVALESALAKLARGETFVVLAGVQKQPREVMTRAGLIEAPGRLRICATDEEALAAVREHLATTS